MFIVAIVLAIAYFAESSSPIITSKLAEYAKGFYSSII